MSNSTPSNPHQTAPLASGTGRGAFEAGGPEATRRIVTMTRATYAKLQPQVELVSRAMAAAGFPVEGASDASRSLASLPLKSAMLVEGLQSTFEQDRGLAEHVKQMLTRYLQTGRTLASVEAALAAGGVEDAQVQELKQAALALARVHEQVKGDPLLAQLFPPPQVLQADVPKSR